MTPSCQRGWQWVIGITPRRQGMAVGSAGMSGSHTWCLEEGTGRWEPYPQDQSEEGNSGLVGSLPALLATPMSSWHMAAVVNFMT